MLANTLQGNMREAERKNARRMHKDREMQGRAIQAHIPTRPPPEKEHRGGTTGGGKQINKNQNVFL